MNVGFIPVTRDELKQAIEKWYEEVSKLIVPYKPVDSETDRLANTLANILENWEEWIES